MSTYEKSIGKEKAIALANSEWWVGMDPKQIAKIGMFTQELCLPFTILHENLEKALGRPVFTHELGLNFDGICQELLGERDAPSLQEIMELIPADKRVIVVGGQP
jgi:hypothetical protein